MRLAPLVAGFFSLNLYKYAGSVSGFKKYMGAYRCNVWANESYPFLEYKGNYAL